ncbi:efflux RND transporter periplasmic adaptor subunit [Pantoea sp. 18069]|uniref:efflux RND transporter periplasmic adaptor subunit n=1 Tax=Pantoea sp. 18069 TaxID=2681415 RepID=UPI00135CD0B1|nr:efflux RND transporter periplasmic adaptor subunit [Pantoea sp. 18069]
MTSPDFSSSFPRRRSRATRYLLPLAAVLALGVLWLALRPAAASPWQTVTVARGDIEASVAAIGTLQPLRSVDVGAQVSGQITRLLVRAGDVVEKGQLLAEIDASVLAATVEAGRAQIAGLRAQADDARAQHELAGQQYARQQQMARDEATRLEDLQTAAATLKSAAARIAQYEAQIIQTAASLRADEARLGYTRIYAPIAGTVTGLDVKEGQTLNATYQTPTVLRIADLLRMTVWTDVSEADIRQVQAGMPAYFSTLGSDRRRWSGTVRQVLPAPAVSTAAPGAATGGMPPAGTKAVQYTVLFDVDNPDGALMPQMTAQVTFVSAAVKDVLTAPLAAFTALDGESGTYEARILAEKTPDQLVEVRRVQLGTRNRLLAEVTGGLEEGERLITGEAPPDAGVRRFQW